MTTVGVIGNGVVGHATARCWMEWSDGGVRVYDKNPVRCAHPLVYPEPGRAVLDCDIVFVCLPETALDEFFTECLTGKGVYPDRVREVNFVLKSTVPVGTTRRLVQKHGLKNLVHSPEFLTARCAVTDAQMPARNIIGCPYGEDEWSWAALRLEELCVTRFPGVSTYVMTSDESEAVKLMVNSFFAVKVALFNEFRTYADAAGLDWDQVLAGILSDGRIAHSHTKVPGPDGYGFSGRCLPKDLMMLIRCMAQHGNAMAEVCSAAHERNKTDRERQS